MYQESSQKPQELEKDIQPKSKEGTNPHKKNPDRRTLYTKGLIKEALLTLIGKKGFDKISIAQVCKTAEISRTTFYLHYDKLTDVLDELVIDALGAADSKGHTLSDISELAGRMRNTPTLEGIQDFLSLLPICQRAADHPKYHAMFLDESASNYILMSIYHSEREKNIPMLSKAYHLSESQADALFLFGLTGAFAVNRSCHWRKDQQWYEKQRALMTFLDGGYSALQKL